MNNKAHSNKLLIFFLIIFAAILGGGAGVFGKIALKEIPSFSFTFLRFFIASVVLLPFSLKCLPTFKRKDYKIIFLSLLASANVVLFAYGIKYTTANISQMIYTAVPIVSALLSFYYLKERFGVNKIIGIVVGFVGTIIVVLLPLISNNNGGSTIGGNLIIVCAMLSISLYWVLSKQFHSQYSSLEINNYFIFTTTILLFFLSIFDFLREPTWWYGVSINAYAALVFVAIFSTAVYYLISQIIVKKSTPVMASMVLYIQPFATFVWAYYFLSEKLSVLFLVGAFFALVGVGIYNFSIKKKNAQNLLFDIENRENEFKNILLKCFGNKDWLKVFLNDNHHGFIHGNQVRLACLKLINNLNSVENKELLREGMQVDEKNAMESVKLIVEIAAIFHDSGRFNEQGGVIAEEQKFHHILSAERAKIFCDKLGLNSLMPFIEDAILCHDFQSNEFTPDLYPPKNISGKIVQAADQMGWFHPDSVQRTLYYNSALGIAFYDKNTTFEERIVWKPRFIPKDAFTVMLGQLFGPTGITRFGIEYASQKVETYKKDLEKNILKIAQENNVEAEVRQQINQARENSVNVRKK
jgi:drug/metabolite transporter (DMT)-like permease